MSCKTYETFDRGVLAAIFISETSNVVSGVTASCDIKQVSFFFLSICFLFLLDKCNYFVLK